MTIAPRDLSPRTTIAVSTLADCPFSIVQDYAAEYLRAAEAGGVESMVHVPWPVPFPSFQHRVALTFGLHLDMVERGRVHDEIRFHWTSGSRLLPDFAGTVRFRIEGRGTRIAIEGSYAAPLGIAGRIIDLVLGRRIARASVTDLARRLDTYVGARQNAWSVLHPAMLV